MNDTNSNINNDFFEAFEKQKKELTQSLQYASYIQQALLPGSNLMTRSFTDYFLIYMPRDIVSGDFYWLSKKSSVTYIAVGDCTGHGVPGAFLSILGISFLNQIIARQPQIQAAGILNILREYLMKALQQTGSEHEQKDGIDMAVCILNNEHNTIQYSGAFNPMYIVKTSGELIEAEPDKMPIGIAAEFENSFSNHHFQLEKDDMIYLFSDGYVDQFGGEKGKKFKYKPFRNLLQEIAGKPLKQQKDVLKNTLTAWMGEIPQLDDVTVLGFRI